MEINLPFHKEVFKDLSILIVEDNRINVIFVTNILNDYSITIDVAENGQLAVEKVKEKHYNLILMDIEMPVMNGYEATEFIRNKLVQTTPIIAMTANARAGEKEKCISFGMNGYIIKPFSPEAIMNLIYKLLLATNPSVDENFESKSSNIINFNYLEDFASGDESIIKEIINVFLEENPKDIIALENAIKSRDFKTLKNKAHSLQTSMGIICIDTSIIETLMQLENLALTETEFETIKEKTNEIVKVCLQVQKELNKLF